MQSSTKVVSIDNVRIYFKVVVLWGRMLYKSIDKVATKVLNVTGSNERLINSYIRSRNTSASTNPSILEMEFL